MLKKEDIYKIYDQYKKDVKCKVELPAEFLIIPKSLNDTIAMIGHVESGFFELYINQDIFYHSRINREYLKQFLYHEFTHVVDNLVYFTDEKDEKKHRKFLFPYTEFHASQIEMKKRLGLFDDPSRMITGSSPIYDADGIKTVKYFINEETREFSATQREAGRNPDIYNVQKIIYMIIYNIGFYSVLQNYNIDNRLPVLAAYPFIQNEFENIYNLLLYDTPSVILCLQTGGYVHKMTKEIAQSYGYKHN